MLFAMSLVLMSRKWSCTQKQPRPFKVLHWLGNTHTGLTQRTTSHSWHELPMCILTMCQSLGRTPSCIHCPSAKCCSPVSPDWDGGVQWAVLWQLFKQKTDQVARAGRERLCICHVQLLLGCCPGAVYLMFLLGLTFLQGCLSRIAGHLRRLSRLKLWAHSPCRFLFVFLVVVPSDPGVSDLWRESHGDFSKGLLCSCTCVDRLTSGSPAGMSTWIHSFL